MLKSESLLQAFSDLEDRYVRSAAALLSRKEEPVKTKMKPILRVALIAAILAALMMGTAYALGLFTMEVRTPEKGEELTGHYTYYDQALQQNVTEEHDLTKSPLVLQFTGEGEIHKVLFRPNWLPEAQVGYTYERYHDENAEDWFWYDTCFFDRSQGGKGVLYQIQCNYTYPGFTCYMSGESARVVKEEDWGKLHITEIEQHTLYKDKDGSTVVHRFVLMFNSAEGWFISIGGGADFETLEHIARELEVRSLDEIADPGSGDYYYLGVGIG